jgi:hypothetical protein
MTEKIKLPFQEIKKIESIDRNTVGMAVSDWAHGKLETALDLYERYGIEVFRKLPEKYWQIKKDRIELFRALAKEELENGPIMFGGKDEKKRIQRLTSWSVDKEFVKSWGEKNIVVRFDAEQNDIAFATLTNSPHIKEGEIVLADYHLKKEKLHGSEST